MRQGFVSFIFSNVTVKMFITIIVYTMFGVILNELIVPFIYSTLDPNKKIENLKLTIGKYTIEYGKSFGDLLIGFTILFFIYFFLK